MKLTRDAEGRWTLDTKGTLIGYDGENMAYTIAIEAEPETGWAYYADLEYQDGTKATMPMMSPPGELNAVVRRQYLLPGMAKMQIRGVKGGTIKKSNPGMVRIGESINATEELEAPEQGVWDEYAAQVEQLRNEAQAAAQAAEMHAEQAEEAAQRGPYIGEGGYWYVWDAEEGAYVNSGQFSGGDAPYIGENGNWFVGAEDSGVPATGPKGDPGADGVSIASVKQTTESKVSSGLNKLRVTLSDGSYEDFTVRNGQKGETGDDGVGVVSVEQIITSDWDGGMNIIRVTLSNGDTADFAVKNGSKGSEGKQGPVGEPGDPGADGVSIVSVEQVATGSGDGGINTIRVTLSDGRTADFTVKNGSKGDPGTAGKTPIKGTDYWTAEDRQELIDEVLEELPEPEGTVLYTPQELTTEQQAQARENIAAAADGDYLEPADVLGWAQRNQFDKANFSGGWFVEHEDGEYFVYNDNGTNFTYTMPHPQKGSVTLTWRYVRKTGDLTKNTGFEVKYSDGTVEVIKNTSLDTLCTYQTPAEKTMVSWTGRWMMEYNVYMRLADISIVADYAAPERADVMSGATADAAGSTGLVPAPAAGDQEKVLYGDGTWKTPDVPEEQIATAVEDYLAANPPEVVLDGYIPNPATAAVGQTIRVSAVDDSGKPTAWEAVDFPSGGGGDQYSLLASVTLEEDATSIRITVDSDGNAIRAKGLYMEIIFVGTSANDSESAAYLQAVVNNVVTPKESEIKWNYAIRKSGQMSGVGRITTCGKVALFECIGQGGTNYSFTTREIENEELNGINVWVAANKYFGAGTTLKLYEVIA